ncbi:hypothetical protein FDECE_16200 [Fusarium decemcellulare]|nr:hypothetical protein FDECE_16200 [Fusarium decemcellulare]
MKPPRLLRVSKVASSSTTYTPFTRKALFSISSKLDLRQRHQRRLSPRTFKQPDSLSRPATSAEPRTSATDFKRTESKGHEASESTQPNYDHNVLGSSLLNGGPKGPRARPAKPKGPSLRGMKPYQQVLYQNESICYRQDTPLPVEVSKQDRPPLAAAEKFFEHGCRILYSAESFYHHTHNDHIPEVVVLGASNAGKSSFLNALVGGMEVAKVSHRPGKTTTMNAYGVGPRPKIARELIRKGDAPPKHSLILMDTPGYGFKSQSDWGKTILKYLNVRKMLRGAVILIPADKKLQDTDRWMLGTLARSNTRTLVVITKADKCGDEWQDACYSLCTQIRTTMQQLEAQAAENWREGSDRMLDVYATAANMDVSRRLGNGGGVGGVRLAILEMAGFSLKDRVEKQPETKAYTGPIVSFDDIVWKT